MKRLCELAADLQLPDLQLKEALEAVVGLLGAQSACWLVASRGAVAGGSGKGGETRSWPCVFGVELRQWPLGTVDVLF